MGRSGSRVSVNFGMKHLLTFAPQTKRLAKAEAEALLLSGIASSNNFTLFLFHCKLSTASCPHEPRLSPAFKLSTTHACSRWEEEWRSGGCGAVALPRSLGEVSSHLLNQAMYMMTCRVSWIIKCHHQTWGSAIRYSPPFLTALSDFAGRSVHCLGCRPAQHMNCCVSESKVKW